MKKIALALLASIPALAGSVGGIALVGGATCLTAGTTAEACPIPNARLRVVSSQPGGLRGQYTTWTVRLTGPDGRPLAYVPVNFAFRSDAHGPRHLSQGCTNSDGRVTLSFRIPTSVNEGNVFLIATSVGGHPVSVNQRVAIGRR